MQRNTSREGRLLSDHIALTWMQDDHLSIHHGQQVAATMAQQTRELPKFKSAQRNR